MRTCPQSYHAICPFLPLLRPRRETWQSLACATASLRTCAFALLLVAANCFGQAPTIVTQPQSQQLSAGASFSLNVAATGAEPLLYQWLRNGRGISQETNSVLVFGNVSPTNTGSYTVSVRNSLGSRTSQVARVEVNAVSVSVNPIAITGWNQDVVLESSPFAGATADFDAFGSLWFEAGWNGHPDGLPNSLKFTSQFNPNVIFQFRPYTANNALRLDTSVSGRTGTLTLTTPAPYRSLAILASSGNGRGSGTVVLNFTDGTSVSNLSFVALDWFDFSANLALAGLGRRNPSSPTPGYEPGATGFGFFETDIDLVARGLDHKFLRSLIFTKPANPSVTGIFAMSGESNRKAVFTLITMLSDGRAQLNLVGFPGIVYQIEASTNLINWNRVASITSANGTLQFTDAGATNQAQRFYRALAP